MHNKIKLTKHFSIRYLQIIADLKMTPKSYNSEKTKYPKGNVLLLDDLITFASH